MYKFATFEKLSGAAVYKFHNSGTLNDNGTVEYSRESASNPDAKYVTVLGTGLADKDGLEIFEGDVLRVTGYLGKLNPDTGEPVNDTFVVRFGAGTFNAVLEDGSKLPLSLLFAQGGSNIARVRSSYEVTNPYPPKEAPVA